MQKSLSELKTLALQGDLLAITTLEHRKEEVEAIAESVNAYDALAKKLSECSHHFVILWQ
jgi:hypothetical protein